MHVTVHLPEVRVEVKKVNRRIRHTVISVRIEKIDKIVNKSMVGRILKTCERWVDICVINKLFRFVLP